jgi:hypothetical protein
MLIAANLIAAALGVVLIAIALAHLLWSFGIMWPIRDRKLLAQTVVGTPDIERMPPFYVSFGVFVLTGIACVIAFAVADPTSGGAALTALAFIAGLVFLARGAVGYTTWWAARRPTEPFRALNRKTYSPLCLILGAGFLVLVVIRLV